MKTRPNWLGLWLVVGCFSILHFLDVYLTLAAGGLAVEANPIAAFLWSRFGLASILMLKLVSVLLIIVNWIHMTPCPRGWIVRRLMGVGILGFMFVVVLNNYLVLSG